MSSDASHPRSCLVCCEVGILSTSKTYQKRFFGQVEHLLAVFNLVAYSSNTLFALKQGV